VSALLTYLAIRTVRWSEVLQNLDRVEYRYLALAALGMTGMHALRAWRLIVLLRPVRRVRAWPAFCYTAVGFLAILAFPFRIGELARPLLLAEQEKVPFATGLATVAVERCLDGLAFAGLIALTAFWLPLPEGAAALGYLMGAGYLLLLGVLVWAWLFRESCLAFILRIGRWATPRWSETISEGARRFLDGLGSLPNSRAVGTAILLSAVIWLVGVCVNYVSFFALDLMLPVVAAAALQVLVTVGVLLPAAPGFVGSYHFFAITALGLFGVTGAVALSYAVLLHATILLTYVLVGVVCGLLLQTGWCHRLLEVARERDQAANKAQEGIR
jgi:uncharacterized protein (TIRG00374 family)